MCTTFKDPASCGDPVRFGLSEFRTFSQPTVPMGVTCPISTCPNLAVSRHALADPPSHEQRAASLCDLLTKGMLEGAGRRDWAQVTHYCQALNDCLVRKIRPGSSDQAAVLRELYCCLTTPQIPSHHLSVWACTASRLVKQHDHIPLTLDWRPLFDLVWAYICRKERAGPAGSTAPDKSMPLYVDTMRAFFEDDAAQHILRRLRVKALSMLCSMLPTRCLRPGSPNPDPFWLPEVMAIWRWSAENHTWHECIFSLLSRLAEHQGGRPGLWDEWFSTVYCNLLALLNLPVAKDLRSPKLAHAPSRRTRQMRLGG
eukprot:gene2785-3406_t